MKISVSPGNIKLGAIPNISLPPGLSCQPGVPCVADCYAQKAVRLYKPAREAWQRNWQIYRDDPEDYFGQVSMWVSDHTPDFFRWHVAGDIPEQRYFSGMINVAFEYSETRFLCFTKNYGVTNQVFVPKNLAVVHSAWPGYPAPPGDLPIAWMQDGTEKRVPGDALKCAGHCGYCGGTCWHLKELGKDVVFNKH